MSIQRPVLRRAVTAIGVIAVLALGYGSIRAASAWTAAEAPLTVAPVSVETLQANLADEQARSQVLTARLRELDARARELDVALRQANQRISGDAAHATDLEGQLADAAKKLRKLETAIAKAKKQLASQVAAARSVRTIQTATVAAPRGHDDEHDDDEGEHDD